MMYLTLHLIINLLSAVTLSNFSSNFPSSFKFSNFSQDFPTAAKLSNFSRIFPTLLGSFPLHSVLSNFAQIFLTSRFFQPHICPEILPTLMKFTV